MGASAIDAALEEFFLWCGKQNHTLCPLAYQNETIKAIWTDLLNRAERKPIPAPSCSKPGVECTYEDVTAVEIRQAVLSKLYFPYTLDAALVANALYNASYHNDASDFAGTLISREKSRYEASYELSNRAISCQDDDHVSSPSDMRWRELIATTQTPLMLGAGVSHASFLRGCIGWPGPKRNPPHRVNIPHSDELPQILLVTNVYDPATPNPMASNLLYEIGEHRARLLTRVALGHTVWFHPEAYDGPTVAAMNKYLLELELPEQGTVNQN